jgi:hypothetical protein
MNMNSRDLGIEPGQVVLLILDPQVKCFLIVIFPISAPDDDA